MWILRLINEAHRWSSWVSLIVVGWVLLLAVLDPIHAWPVMGIDVELAIETRHDGVEDEGGSRGDIISTTRKLLFQT